MNQEEHDQLSQNTNYTKALAYVSVFALVLAAFVVWGTVSVESSQTLPMDEHLDSLRGGRVNPLQLIESTAYAVALQTREQLEADGWFPSESI